MPSVGIFVESDFALFDQGLNKGLTSGYPYRRIDDAYYAWRAEIRESAAGRVPGAMVCQTLDEFIVKYTGSEMAAAA
jgi:hypothetical protein